MSEAFFAEFGPEGQHCGCLRAAHETATGDAGDAHESRAEHQHARWLGDIDVGIALGGGWKNGNRGCRSRDRLLRMNGSRGHRIRLARE